MAEEWDNHLVLYLYDADGSPIGMQYRNTTYAEGVFDTYWFEKNLQGDVVAVYNQAGTKLISYTYNAWGSSSATYYNGGASTTAKYNPFRYRGYYLDSETGFYYLNSRYYDPAIGRFITADKLTTLKASSSSTTDKNLYAYCDNNPVTRTDDGGMFWDTLFDVVSLCVSIAEVVANPTDPFAWAGVIGDTVDLIPFVSGVGEVTRAVNGARKLIDKSEDALDAARKLYKGADKASDWRKATGSYEILYESGQTYVGKGGFKRAIKSAEKHADGKRVVAIRWEKADNARQAFIDEYKKMCHYGGPNNSSIRNKNSLNSIWSPGRKYYLEDFGSYYSYGGKTW